MFYSIFVLFFVLLIGILSLTVFFNIKDIAVTGNSYYTAEQIIQSSGLSEGQNLFRLNKFKVIEKMCEKMPYLSEVSIDRHLPVGIEIIVTECTPFAYVETNGVFCIIDEKLKILEKTDVAPENLPAVVGITPSVVEEGAYLSDESGLSVFLGTLTEKLYEHIGQGKVTEINVAASYDISFRYLDHLDIKVGTVEKIDQKIRLVNYMIEENKSTQPAIIDVSSIERAFYRPVDPEPEPEPEQPTDEQQSEDSADAQQPQEETEDEKENE